MKKNSTDYVFTDISKTNELDIKTKEGKKYHYTLILKRVYASHTLECELDSLCTDSINIQRNVKTNIPFVSSNKTSSVGYYPGQPDYVYIDQISEVNGLVTYRWGCFSRDYRRINDTIKTISFTFKHLNRNYSNIIKSYTIGKDVIINGNNWNSSISMYYEFSENAKDLEGTVNITSYDKKSNTVSGTYSFTCTSDYKGYKSSPAKITVTDGKFENISLWGDK